MSVDLAKLAAVRAAQILFEALVAERAQLRVQRTNLVTLIGIKTDQIAIARDSLITAKADLAAELDNTEPLPP